jgi:putative hydrolase of the HAD superfamily
MNTVKPPMPKAILLDMDDTLLAFDAATHIAKEKVCTDYVAGHNCPFDVAGLRRAIDKVKSWYWADPDRHRRGRLHLQQSRREVFELAFDALSWPHPEDAREMADSYSALQMQEVTLFPESIPTLQALSSRQLKLGLVTNGESRGQRSKIDRFDLARHFDHLLIEEEVGVGKPDVRVFELALSQLGVHASEAWMIGDNLVWDVDAPQKIGIFSIWNDFRGNGLPENSPVRPDRIVRNVSSLLALLDEASHPGRSLI